MGAGSCCGRTRAMGASGLPEGILTRSKIVSRHSQALQHPECKSQRTYEVSGLVRLLMSGSATRLHGGVTCAVHGCKAESRRVTITVLGNFENHPSDGSPCSASARADRPCSHRTNSVKVEKMLFGERPGTAKSDVCTYSCLL